MAAKNRGGAKAPQSTKKSGQTNGGGDLARLEQVLELMNRHDIAELEWEKSGERFHMKKPGAFVAAAPSVSYAPAPQVVAHAAQAPAAPAHHAAPAAPAAAAGPAATPANHKQIVSPFVGTFYRSSSPTAEPYVKEGQAVKRGDRMCIIEAMKLMNEIEAEFSGKVISVLAENGQPVEFGEPLFVVET